MKKKKTRRELYPVTYRDEERRETIRRFDIAEGEFVVVSGPELHHFLLEAIEAGRKQARSVEGDPAIDLQLELRPLLRFPVPALDAVRAAVAAYHERHSRE